MAHDDDTTQVLEVRRTSIGEAEVHREPNAELADGQIRLRIDHFAVTANNVSYAGAGDLLGYWDFFPSPGAPEWGRVPAVGYAEIVESRHPDLAVGGRYHGWFPMAETVTFTATARRDGFRDDGPHRQAHAPIYRSYTRTDVDPFHEDGPEAEERHALLRVLLLTGFLADEFFADSGGAVGAAPFFGAEQVIVLSASSKTAIGFAQRAAQRDGLSVIGVTSVANAHFVRALGYYDTVVTYDDVASIAAVDSVVIDMAGNASVLADVHAHLGDRLRYSMMIGKSHHDAAPPAGALAGPAPVFFFAPSEVERRVAAWGAEEYRRRTVEATREFIESSRTWMSIERHAGADGPAAAWSVIHGGAVPPSVGVIASFHG
ncbi:MAG TPA: DUF2855 family protein [Ilumatobacteraceae bacterium]|nr:DUF2855 family protein [Ilumatobacteraceae bacterium]